MGPGIPPILAQKDLRRAAALGDFLACLADTGGLSVPPVSRLYAARPLAFNPPSGFLPSLRCHAGDFAMFIVLGVRDPYEAIHERPKSFRYPRCTLVLHRF